MNIIRLSLIVISFTLPSLSFAETKTPQKKEVINDRVKNNGTVKNPYANPTKPELVRGNTRQLGKKPTYIKKPLPNITSRKVKVFNIAGPLAITKAKRHGYRFKGDEECQFNGSAWIVQPRTTGTYCKMDGFISPSGKRRCSKLRKGWEIKDMKFNRAYKWMIKYKKFEPGIRMTIDNQTQGPLMLMLKTLTLVGPAEGSFEDAFSHCDDATY